MAAVYWRIIGNGESLYYLKVALLTAQVKHRKPVNSWSATSKNVCGLTKGFETDVRKPKQLTFKEVSPGQYLSHLAAVAIFVFHQKILPKTSAYLENALALIKADPPVNTVAASGLRTVKCILVGQK